MRCGCEFCAAQFRMRVKMPADVGEPGSDAIYLVSNPCRQRV